MSTIDPVREVFAPLLTSRFASLTTFKRDGQGVSSPMGFRIIDGKGYFTTYSGSWKVKRMANNAHVTLAPCTQRGQVTGASVEGTVRRLEGSEFEQKYPQFANPFNRLLFSLFYSLRYKSVPLLYEVTFDQSA